MSVVHPLRMMLAVTDTTPTSFLDRFRAHLPGSDAVEGIDYQILDGLAFPIVRGGADGDGEGGGEGEGEGSGSGGEGSGEGEGSGSGGGHGEGEGDGGAGSKKVELTQAELDAMIQKASGRAAKDAEKRIKDEAAKASLDEVDRLKLEKEEATKAAADTSVKAAARIVRAEAKLVAQAADVDPKRIDAFLRTVDLTDIEVDDDGEPDAKALAKVVNDGLKAIPEFKATKGTGRSGSTHNGETEEGRPKDLASAVAARMAS